MNDYNDLNLHLKKSLYKNYNKDYNEDSFYRKTKNNNYFIDEDKKRLREEERKKKLRYQMMLDEQVKEKRIRERIEREKRELEDLLYEEKFRLEQKQINEYRNERERGIKNVLQKESIDNPLNNGNYHYILKRNISDINEEQNSQKMMMMDLNNNNNIIYEQHTTPPTIENLVLTSNQNNPNLNINRINPQGYYKTQNYYYPNNKINAQLQPNYFISENLNPYKTQNKPFDHQQKIQNSLSEVPTNLSVSPINYQNPININRMMTSSPNIINNNLSQSNYFGNSNNNINIVTNMSDIDINRIPFNNSQNVNELVNININNQNVISKMMEIFLKEQNKIIESYKETIRQLKNERDEALIKNKANEEKLIALQNIQNFQKKISEKYNYFPFKDYYKEDLDNFLYTIQKNELNINNQDTESNNNISIYPPLITSTKLVKPNSKEDILETWKKEDKNDKIENGKKLEFNGMDTNYMMNKISQIKNTILENSNISINKNNDKDNKCMINISSISKTNEDKSNEKYNDDINKNNDTNTEFEFHIENNEDINKEEGNLNSLNDSAEIISNNNKYIADEADLEKKSETIIEDNKNNTKNNSKGYINYKDKIEEPKEALLQSRNIYNNLKLYNKDNNVSISKQLSKREIYINNKEDKQNNINIYSNNNFIFDNDKTMKNNDDENIKDFPNIDSPHKEAITVQTFNPNNYKDKNIESSLVIRPNNQEEQEIMKKMNYFEENSFLNYNKEKSKKKDIIGNNNNILLSTNELKNNELNSSNELYKEYKRNKNDSVNLENQMKESSILNESLNTFTQNLNKKWKDMTKDDINNMNKKDDNILSNNELKKNKLISFNKENTIDKFDEIRKNH